jgi:hypothetical protein
MPESVFTQTFPLDLADWISDEEAFLTGADSLAALGLDPVGAKVLEGTSWADFLDFFGFELTSPGAAVSDEAFWALVFFDFLGFEVFWAGASVLVCAFATPVSSGKPKIHRAQAARPGPRNVILRRIGYSSPAEERFDCAVPDALFEVAWERYSLSKKCR